MSESQVVGIENLFENIVEIGFIVNIELVRLFSFYTGIIDEIKIHFLCETFKRRWRNMITRDIYLVFIVISAIMYYYQRKNSMEKLPETDELSHIASSIAENISLVIVGKESQVKLLILGLCSGLHSLIQDIPGVGKTTLARSLAKSVGLDFARIQFTPDLLPGDIIGMTVWNPEKFSFVYREGAVMHEFILADEVNRASPRTQSSLLEAMQEGSVSLEGITYRPPEPFFLVATRNPENFTGIFPLPEGQLDRFGLSFSMGYPSPEEEIAILDRFKVENPLERLKPVCSSKVITAIRKAVRSIYIKPVIENYLVQITGKTRTSGIFRYGASPRASQHLLLAAQTNAFLEGRNFVIPEDIRFCAPYVLSHRLALSAESIIEIPDTETAVRKVTDSLPVPTGF